MIGCVEGSYIIVFAEKLRLQAYASAHFVHDALGFAHANGRAEAEQAEAVVLSEII